MRRLMLLIFWVGLLSFASGIPAQQRTAADRVGTGAVTILTDGISDPQGEVSKAFGQLAARVSDVGKQRVLPLMGQGGQDNVRDLLHLRGIDFAVLNSDILAFLDLTRSYPEARRRIRYVAPLFGEKIYLIARKRITALEQLRNRKIVVLGPDSPGFVSAMTVFALLGIDVQVTAWSSGAALNDAALGDADAALIVGRELARLQIDQQSAAELRVLTIPQSARLAGVYRATSIGPDEIPGLIPAAGVQTLQVTTLLTVFDWKTVQPLRYQPVVNFVRVFFAALPELQKDQTALWKDVNVAADVPGWERYGPADELLRSMKPTAGERQVAILPPLPQRPPALPRQKSSVPPLPQRPPLLPGTPLPVTAEDDGGLGPLRVLLVNRPPLTDASLAGGGLITELLSAGLAGKNGAGKSLNVSWTASRVEQLNTLLSGKGAEVALPWEAPDCNRPNDLGATSAVVCDRLTLSQPIFQVVIGLFVRGDSDFTFNTDESVKQKVFCIQRDADTSDFDRDGRNWLAQQLITVVKGASLIDCLGLVDRREADAAVANELEGRYVLERLGLASDIRMLERPLATRSIHAAVAKDNPRANEVLRAIDTGVAGLKSHDGYVDVVSRHVLGLLVQQGGR